MGAYVVILIVNVLIVVVVNVVIQDLSLQILVVSSRSSLLLRNFALTRDLCTRWPAWAGVVAHAQSFGVVRLHHRGLEGLFLLVFVNCGFLLSRLGRGPRSLGCFLVLLKFGVRQEGGGLDVGLGVFGNEFGYQFIKIHILKGFLLSFFLQILHVLLELLLNKQRTIL